VMMLIVAQMINDFLLYQITPKEGHHDEPRSTDAPNEENRATQLRHSKGSQQADRGPPGHHEKCSTLINANDNFCKAIVGWFEAHIDSADIPERVYTNPVAGTPSLRLDPTHVRRGLGRGNEEISSRVLDALLLLEGLRSARELRRQTAGK